MNSLNWSDVMDKSWQRNVECADTRDGIHEDQIAENLEIFAKRYSETGLPSRAIDFFHSRVKNYV
jgi:hypothetical protein